MPPVMNNSSGHFIQIGLGQAGLLRPAGVQTFHDLNFKISSNLIESGKILTAIKACYIRNMGQSSSDTAHGMSLVKFSLEALNSVRNFSRSKKVLTGSLSDRITCCNQLIRLQIPVSPKNIAYSTIHLLRIRPGCSSPS
jgi:hypothetical protein